MFFKPKILIDIESRGYIDECIDWILQTFGPDYLSKKVPVLPGNFFQNGYAADDEHFEMVCKQVCKIMDIDHRLIHFEITVNDQALKTMRGSVHSSMKGSGFAGYYKELDGSASVYIEETSLEEPISLVAVVAHELSHYKLLYELQLDEHDEYLTDMVPAFFGLGIFGSSAVNTLVNYNTITGSGWRMRRTGYLSEYMHGYLLAQWILRTKENVRRFGEELKPNVFQSYKATLRVLDRW